MPVSIALPNPFVEAVLLPPVRDLGDDFSVLRALPSPQRHMVGPFAFLDHFGPVVFAPNQGMNVRAHPHIGLSTLTYLLQGEIAHRDSLGTEATVRAGDVNWMTAGSGIVHSERTAPFAKFQGSKLFGQQIWVALPKAQEEMAPQFQHCAQASLPEVAADGASITIVAGSAFGQHSPVSVHSDLMYVDLVLSSGGRVKVPGEHIERAMYVVSGEVLVEGQSHAFTQSQFVILRPGAEVVIRSRTGAQVILIGGEPFSEPRFVYWNFVSSSRERIEQAKDDWRHGRFAAIAGETEFIPLPDDPPAASDAA